MVKIIRLTAKNGAVKEIAFVDKFKLDPKFVGAKVEVTATGGGTGALTWSTSGGGCTLSVVDAITQTIQKNGNGTCTVTVRRAASSGRAASEVSQTFTWSNK
jgi:hypothetical protein